jgi:outer membrane protein assembly factor BamE (lipoprotein component of BamABCDE complex)
MRHTFKLDGYRHYRCYNRYMRNLYASLIAFYFLILTGCQTLPEKDFETLKPGMDKHTVLETMGSPNATVRRSGQDRWYYTYYQNEVPVTKEVRFQEGMAVHAGDTIKPAISAEEQDKLNEASNAAAVAEYEAKQAELKASGASKVTPEEPVKYVPNFEPIR